jgi:hypothetical protein
MIEQQQQQQHQNSAAVIDLASGHLLAAVAPPPTTKSNNRVAQDVVVVPVADLQHEHLFHATIKSCLPSSSNKNKKCGEYVPPPPPPTGSNNNNNKPIQKVALLAPPGDLAHHIWNQMEVIMLQHNNLNSQNQNTAAAKNESSNVYDMDIIKTSHVPPYGYGKTHGLTKIVRLVAHPIVLQVTNALQAVLEPDEWLRLEEEQEDNNNIEMNDFVVSLLDLKIALRQVLRFHCRLSHVAAHTAILSFDMMDILQQSDTNVTTTLALRNFLTPLDVSRILHKKTDDDVVELYVPDDDNDDENDNLGHDLWDEQERMGTRMLSLVQARLQKANDKTTTTTTLPIMAILDQVLVQEMQLTKNMTVWPCPSFWAAGDGTGDGGGENMLTPLTRRLAQALSPDCNHHQDSDNNNNNVAVSCWVERDKCEAAGDAICQGNTNKNKNAPKKQQQPTT